MFDFIAQAAEPVITGLDVVKTVDAFYYNAWLMLVGIFVLFGSIIGVVMPLIIQHIQSSSFDKTEKRLKDEIEQIKNKTQESIQGEVEVIKSKFVEIQKNIEKKIDKETRANRAVFYSQLATSMMLAKGSELTMFTFSMFAVIEFAVLKNYEGLTRELERVIVTVTERIHPLSETATAETKELAKQNQTEGLKQLDELSKILEGQSVINRYSEQLAKVYDFWNNYVIVADKPEPPEEPEQERA